MKKSCQYDLTALSLLSLHFQNNVLDFVYSVDFHIETIQTT